MKHKLQWKLIGIMCISVIAGVSVMGIVENGVFDKIFHLSAEEAEVQFATYSVWFNLIFIIVTILVFWLLSRKIAKRIEILKQNTELIAKGDLALYKKDNHRDELGILSQEMYRMAEQIETSIENEKNMICNMAHDLRTPITSISGYVDLLQEETLSDKGRENVNIITRKSKELSEQINELLEYSILDFRNKEYEMTAISISSLIEQILVDFIPMLEKEHYNYSLKGNAEKCVCSCNQALCIRLFDNLLVNAIRYGQMDKRIEIELTDQENAVTIAISNFGYQIPEEEISHLFERFYQGADAKTYQTKSKGLGLAIAKQIVDIHGGSLQVENSKSKPKVTFSVTLPK